MHNSAGGPAPWPGSRLLLAAAGLLLSAATGGYVAAARNATGAGGVPLDDAWIHQTLARNLAWFGQLVIVPGEPSAAATSPLWGALLAVPYWLGLPPLVWALALGVACLAGTAWAAYRLALALFARAPLAWAAALLTLAEWRLVWAALSGMETLLFSMLTLAALALAVAPARPAALLGTLCGLAAATRPEGLALLALVGVWSAAVERQPPARLAGYLAGAVLPLLPVAALNLAQHGNPLPATFFAKNAAYAAGLDPGRVPGFAGAALAVLARGPELLLLPGLAIALVAALRRIWAPPALPLVWAGGLVLAYAWWLPALYHHGRYLFPLLPLALVYGLYGSQLLAARLAAPRVARVWVAALLVYAGLGLVRGAEAFAGNVAFINSQHVWAAAWVHARAPAGEAVAAHDIGALSYFRPGPLIDMAGLATPALLAGPRNVEGVVHLLRERNVRVALAIPDWYPPLYQALTGPWGGTVAAVAPPFPGVAPDQRMHVLTAP